MLPVHTAQPETLKCPNQQDHESTQLSAICKSFLEPMRIWVGVHLHWFSEPSLHILLLQCFPSPFFFSYQSLHLVWKQYYGSMLKTTFLQCFGNSSKNIAQMCMKSLGDAFDCALLDSVRCFWFLDRSRIYPCRSHLFGQSTKPSCSLHMQEQGNEGVGSWALKLRGLNHVPVALQFKQVVRESCTGLRYFMVPCSCSLCWIYPRNLH